MTDFAFSLWIVTVKIYLVLEGKSIHLALKELQYPIHIWEWEGDLYELSQSAITDADQTGGSEDTFLFTRKKSLSHRSLRKTGCAFWLLGWIFWSWNWRAPIWWAVCLHTGRHCINWLDTHTMHTWQKQKCKKYFCEI